MGTLEELKARHSELRLAESRILKSQRYKIGNRENERASLATVQASIKDLESQIGTFVGSRSKRIIFKDY